MKTFTFLDGAKPVNIFTAENLTIMENLTFFTLDERLENIDALFNLLKSGIFTKIEFCGDFQIKISARTKYLEILR